MDEETAAAAVDGAAMPRGSLEALVARELDDAVRPQVLAFLSANGINSPRTLAYLAEEDLSDAFRMFPGSVSLGTKGAVRALLAVAKREVEMEGKPVDGLSDRSDDEAALVKPVTLGARHADEGLDEERGLLGVAGARPPRPSGPSEKVYNFEDLQPSGDPSTAESPTKCRVGHVALLLLACLLLGALVLLGERMRTQDSAKAFATVRAEDAQASAGGVWPLYSAAAQEVWVQPGDWAEEMIHGRGHFVQEAVKCAASARRRQTLPGIGRKLWDATPTRWTFPPERRRAAGDASSEGTHVPRALSRPKATTTTDTSTSTWTGQTKTTTSTTSSTAASPPEVPLEEPPRVWTSPPPELAGLKDWLTTWRCVPAHGSQLQVRNACHFRNLYYEGFGRSEGSLQAHVLRSKATVEAAEQIQAQKLFTGMGSVEGLREARLAVVYHDSLGEFAARLRSTSTFRGHEGEVVVQPNLTLVFLPIYHFNVGHGIWDGLYPAFVSLLQLGLEMTPARGFVLSRWETGVERQIPGMYRKVEGIFARILGWEQEVLTMSKLNWGAQKAGARITHRFEEAVVGLGTNSQKMDQTANQTLGACRELDACRSFRQRVMHFQNLPQPGPARTKPPFRVILIQNKRYRGGSHGNMVRIAAALKEMAKPGGVLQDFEINYVDWSPNNREDSMQTGNFSRHMEIIQSTDIHISGPGTGQMYQTFLPDGAVHIALGQLAESQQGRYPVGKNHRGVVMQGYMEEYMAEGAPYLKALFHPQYTSDAWVTTKTLTPLLQEAGELLRQGIPARPPPIGAKSSPVARLFKAYAYLAHRDTVGLESLKRLAPIWEMRGETWLGNHFPEDIVYAGHYFQPWMKQNECLLEALRASYDRTFPNIGAFQGRGWFNTGGDFDAAKWAKVLGR